LPEFDLVVLGEINVDLILTGDVMPEFGQREKLVTDAALFLGSSSAIFACGAGRLGLRTAFIGKVGDDDFGRFMVERLEERGVDTSGVLVDPSVKTGLSVILSRGQDRAILTYLGSIDALRGEDVNREILKRARHLHVASYFLQRQLQPSLPELFAMARAWGLSTSLDTNWDPDERWDDYLPHVLNQVDVFLPNENEALAISGADELDSATRSLMELIPLVVIKRGMEGAFACRGDEVVHQAAFPVASVDSTGAGDSFDAGFLYGFLRGKSLAESLQLGCVCGALCTTQLGGRNGQPSLEEAEAFLRERS